MGLFSKKKRKSIKVVPPDEEEGGFEKAPSVNLNVVEPRAVPQAREIDLDDFGVGEQMPPEHVDAPEPNASMRLGQVRRCVGGVGSGVGLGLE